MHPDEYIKMFAVEDTHWWFVGKRKLAGVFLDALPAQATRKILDVGCGTGGMHALLRSYGSVCGVDMSEIALGLAARRANAHLQYAALPHLPFADATFDLVTLFDVLYHRCVADDWLALREVARVLRPHGHVLITDSALGFLRGPHDETVHGARRYTTGEIRAKLHSAGFAIQRVSYADFFIFPIVAGWRIARRFIATAEGSDVHPTPNWLNASLSFVYRLEAGLLSRVNLPVGTSIIALAQKS
jgi:SAM-dependent methyltransferase